MKFFKTLCVSSLLLVGHVCADGFGFNLGPFNMEFSGSGGDDYVQNERNLLDSPICNAISSHQRLEITVHGKEIVSSKEKKIIIKKLLVEPYVFGITKSGKPVLHGNLVGEKMIKEVSVKFGDDEFDEPSEKTKQKGKGYFSGVFTSGKNITLDVRKVSDVHVVIGSHFELPKNYKGLKNENVQIICQIALPQSR